MFVDANVDGTSVGECDTCIVGAGAAGITLAVALAERGLTVCLVESGGLQLERATQALYDGVIVGDPYLLSISRLRYFGGATNHWGGMCHELDEEDFLPREWIPNSGWPIRKTDLDPYYDRACGVLELPPRRRFEEVEERTDVYPRLLRPTMFEPILCLKSPPTRMGKRYREAIARNDRIRCCLHANVVEIVPNAEGTAILQLRAKTLGGRSLAFVARNYVLCAGAIENARLLLASDTVIPGGIGNRHGLVGRYFQDHPNCVVGSMVAAPPPGARGFQEEYVQERAKNFLHGVWGGSFCLSSTPDARRDHRLLGCAVYFHRTPQPSGATAAKGVEELVAHANASPGGAPAGTSRYTLTIIAEQAPDPANRVLLSAERDALDQRRIAVDIRLQSNDLRSVTKTLRMLAFEVGRAGRGRVQLEPFPTSQWALLPGHHIGTTRMSDDPMSGVTDRNGKVHGMANLFVGGSSLFPTGGWANPTLTIVTLALRQADWLASNHDAKAPEVRS